MLKKQKILNEIKQLLNHHFENEIKDVLLFGSQASGKANKNSDYDILIVLKTSHDWKKRNRISEICYDIDLKYDIVTDIHVISENELQNSLRGYQPIFQNAIKNGIYA